MRIAHRLCRNRERVREHAAPLDFREVQRISQHLHEIVLDQECLVFVDSESDVPLRRVDKQIHSRVFDTQALKEFVHPLDETEPRIGQIDGVDRMF